MQEQSYQSSLKPESLSNILCIFTLFSSILELNQKNYQLQRPTMNVHDSGMPEEEYWNSLFDIPTIVHWLNVKSISGPIVEVGCGYGTFTLPVAKEVTEEVLAFDIEPAMIETTQRHVSEAGFHNVQFFQRDIIDQGTGLDSDSVGMVFLFNILHFAERRIMLEEATRILKPSGKIAIIHWRKDIATPRGPAIPLRPDKQMIIDAMTGLDLSLDGNDRNLEPYHWGIQLIKGKKK
jgi:SAM-dependent methyltransferase